MARIYAGRCCAEQTCALEEDGGQLDGDPKWTPESIQAAIDSGEPRTITLPKPIAVHILYWTAWADADGTVEFRKDIYGHDAELEQALATEPAVWLHPDLGGQTRAAR